VNVAAETTTTEDRPEDKSEAPADGRPAGGRSSEVRELERQLDELRQKLTEAEARATENVDRWQRAQADLANYRRRAQFDREEMQKYGAAALVSAVLPVLDSFDRAWQTLPGQLRHLTWLSGIDMINLQLRGILERIGLTEIEAEGQPFDPARHEAIDREEHEGPPHVVAVLQAGYKLHERVLRPALVKVGAKPASRSESSEAQVATQPDTQPEPPTE
jgi:molecular chaperone GrpE